VIRVIIMKMKQLYSNMMVIYGTSIL